VIAAAVSVDAPRVTWDTDISIRPHRGDQGRPNQANARFCPGPSGTSGWPWPRGGLRLTSNRRPAQRVFVNHLLQTLMACSQKRPL